MHWPVPGEEREQIKADSLEGLSKPLNISCKRRVLTARRAAELRPSGGADSLSCLALKVFLPCLKMRHERAFITEKKEVGERNQGKVGITVCILHFVQPPTKEPSVIL